MIARMLQRRDGVRGSLVLRNFVHSEGICGVKHEVDPIATLA
jgi:hypothetical protein